MDVFTPTFLNQPTPQPMPAAMPLPIEAPVIPAAPLPAPLPAPPQQVFVPYPVAVPAPRKTGMKVSPEAVRKAQSIYPTEQKAKAQMIDQAKVPTPTGAWGAPK